MSEPKASNLTWHDHSVTKSARTQPKNQKPCILWLTGLSGSGKSTIANALEQRLVDMGRHTYLLDGDNIRQGLNKNLGFSPEDRTENIRRIGEVAKLFVDAGIIVMSAFISPYRSDRDEVRALVEEGEFIEVFVDTPLEVCEERDPKGLYQKARAGEIKQFTGISAPYEAPLSPEITLHPAEDDVEASVDRILAHLQAQAIL